MRIRFHKALAPLAAMSLLLPLSASRSNHLGPVEDLAAQSCTCLSGTTAASPDLSEKLISCVYMPFQQNFESLSQKVGVPAGADAAVYLNEKYEDALEAKCPGYRNLALKAALLD